MAENQNMVELTEPIVGSSLCNADIYPTPIKDRTWKKRDIISLWIGMAVCIPTYMMAASILGQGLNWWQAVSIILLGNVIVLIPMLLNAHPGTKYGIPFPVLSRASFGTSGAHIPAILRALVACGWFGIQTWIGGTAIYICICTFAPGFGTLGNLPTGINVGEFISFLIFWAINIAIIIRGIESIRWLEDWAAPVLILIGVVLLFWGFSAGGGVNKVLQQSYAFTKPTVVINNNLPFQTQRKTHLQFNTIQEEGKSRVEKVMIAFDKGQLQKKMYPFKETLEVDLPKTVKNAQDVFIFIQFVAKKNKSSIVSKRISYDPTKTKQTPVPAKDFWQLFFPLLTAMVGFWATLSLNIPDFTRYASSQSEHVKGQIIGLPPAMAFYSFVGIVATSAGIIVFKDILIASDIPWDPVTLLKSLDNKLLVVLAMIALGIATLSTNLAANVVAPANGFSNLWPEKISFKMGGAITGLVGIFMMPWYLISSTQYYIFTWLIGYSALLGPIAAIVIADYYLVRKMQLSLGDLYREDGKYSYKNGVNYIAVIALVLGVLPNIPGFLAAAGFVERASFAEIFHQIYTYAWFVGFAISFVFYTIAMLVSGHKE